MERGHRPHARVTPRKSRGQILVIFAGAIVALLTLCSLVVDVAWYWSVNLRIQRAADAAALAGVHGGIGAAARVAAANGGALTSFVTAGADVTVSVMVSGVSATARATDGP